MYRATETSGALRLCRSLILLAALAGCATDQTARETVQQVRPEPRPAYSYRAPQLEPGIYAANYVSLIDDSAPWLAPVYFAGLAAETKTTKDMERATFDMIEQGYVMIGFASVNSREAGIDRVGEIGSARDAAIWAGADVAIIQRNFSGTARIQVTERLPIEYEQENMERLGASENLFDEATNLAGHEQRDTRDQFQSVENWRQNGQQGEFHAEVGVNLGVGDSIVRTRDSGSRGFAGGGSSATDGQYAHLSQTAGAAQGRHRENTLRERKLWVAQLVEKEVDHYDHLVTFWRKVLPDPLGATATDLTPALRWELATNRGVLLLGTVKNSPAYLADLLTDDVLLAINGVRIRNTEHFYQLTQAYAGQSVELSLWRDGAEQRVAVDLLTAEETRPRRNGPLAVELADTATLDGDLRNYLYQYHRNARNERDEGALIKRVYPASVAERSGFRPGDVILEIGGEKIAGTRQVPAALRRHSGRSVPVTLLRKGEVSTVELEL